MRLREQHRFGLSRGAGRGQDAGYVVRRDGGGVFNWLIARAYLRDRGQLGVLRRRLVHERHRSQRRYLVDDAQNLALEVDLRHFGGADERPRAHEVHAVDEVGVVEVARKRVHDRAGLEGCHIDDAELRPRRHLERDHVPGGHPLLDEPCCQARRLVVYLAVRVGRSLVVADVRALRMGGDAVGPYVAEGLLGPVSFLVVELLSLRIDFEIGNHRP